jgi:hypothetical protein
MRDRSLEMITEMNKMCGMFLAGCWRQPGDWCRQPADAGQAGGAAG